MTLRMIFEITMLLIFIAAYVWMIVKLARNQ